MSRSISWILEFTSKLPNDEEKIKCMQANANVLKPVLDYTFNPDKKWLLPEGKPPYRPNTEALPTDMYKELRKLYIFIEGGKPDLHQLRRESLFLDLLESIPADDAELLLHMKDKKLPYAGITKKLVLKAFPGLF